MSCVGAEDLFAIRQWSLDHEVVAVALDLDEGPSLRQLHDQACAAGAARCHVLDVREEFLRACVLPAIYGDAAADESAFTMRARDFMAKKLAIVAELEGVSDVIVASAPTPNAARFGSSALDRSAHVAISFDDGVPVAVNDVPMTLPEMMDCLTTIGAAHGIDRPRPALHILHAAHRQMCPTTTSAQAAPATGVAWLELRDGRIQPHEPEFATT
jgi:argininosuccinate synthase